MIKILYQNTQWMLQDHEGKGFFVVEKRSADPTEHISEEDLALMSDDEVIEANEGYWLPARDLSTKNSDDYNPVYHVGQKSWVDLDQFEDIVKNSVRILELKPDYDIDQWFFRLRKERKTQEHWETQRSPRLHKPSEIDCGLPIESIDDGKETSITISCHRETNRLTRLMSVYQKALTSAYNLGEHNEFRAGLKKLHDHKGQMTAVWRSVTSCHKLKIHIQAAWEDSGENEIVHEDEGGKTIA